MMRKITLFIAALLLFTAHRALAQLPYTLTTSNQTYQPLTGATSLNGTTAWDDDSFSVAMPFSFNLGGPTVSRLTLDLANGVVLNGNSGVVSGFSYGDMDLVDRSYFQPSGSSSPIQYVVTGASPSRILKLEIANAGFYDDTLDQDVVNIQMWFYETSNIVELRYGPSTISTTDYFFQGNGPAVGYAKDFDLDNGTAAAFYTLAGSPAAPAVDSIDLITGDANVLNSYPPNGTVYRFTPTSITTPNNIGTLAAFTGVAVYPTLATDHLNIRFNNQQPAEYRVVAADGRSTGIGGTLMNGLQKADISRLPQGNYFLKVENSQNRSVYRFSKN